ncbi:MAG: protoporphyrinogen oxidase [Lentisphaeria bacterium]|nr:protoporphyrinogen oxidase [Candidatus Neomarinimicrobiota bacterium]MCF7842765.1 protoporphyrinogen oxidase [Lentisphaeria bacterium]
MTQIQSQSQSQSTIVIGGGIAGLTVAYRLQSAGGDVTLLEANDQIGGPVQTVLSEGFLAELGPNTILETSPRVTALVTDLGLDEQKVYANDASAKRFLVRNKQPHALPSSPGGMLTTPLFSPMGKLGMVKELFKGSWDNRYEESLAQFVVRRLGKEFLDYVINPFVAGVYAGDPEHLSVKHGFPKLYELEQKYGGLVKGQIKGAKERKKRQEKSKQAARMFSFKGGLKMLPEMLATKLGNAVRKNARVTDISQIDGKWQVSFSTGGGAVTQLQAEKVIYAGTAFGIPNLTVNGRPEPEFKPFDEIYHPPVFSLTLGFKREDVQHPLDGFGMLIPKVEGFNILGALFTSTLFPMRAPQDHVTLTIFIGGVRQPELAAKPVDELITLALVDLKVTLGVTGKPVYTHHQFWPKAIPQYDVGYGQYKDRLDELESRYPGLYFTGNYRNGISVADTIKNAVELSDRLLGIEPEEDT